jgi:hypothetical protein
MKARQIKKIRFNSLRDGLGDGLGVINDIDTQVVRKCRVVHGEYGLKWQLVKDDEYMHHYCNETDQECLNETEINDVEVVNEPMKKYAYSAQRGASLAENYSLLPF